MHPPVHESDEGAVDDFDREHGYPLPCSHCGFGWGHHSGDGSKCPGRRADGTLWRMQFEPGKSPGTNYKAALEVVP